MNWVLADKTVKNPRESVNPSFIRVPFLNLKTVSKKLFFDQIFRVEFAIDTVIAHHFINVTFGFGKTDL